MADANLALSRLRSLVRNVENERSRLSEPPYTREQAVNIARQFAENFAALDAAITKDANFPREWETVLDLDY